MIAVGLEGFSLRTAIAESREPKGDDSWLGFIRHAKIPELPVVLLEDVAALIGLVLALGGVGLATATGQPVWDGIGTVGIGVLLLVVAVVLIVETKSLLLGESASPAQVRTIAEALVGDGDRAGGAPAHHAPRPGRGAGRRQGRPATAGARWRASPPRSTRRKRGCAPRSRRPG